MPRRGAGTGSHVLEARRANARSAAIAGIKPKCHLPVEEIVIMPGEKPGLAEIGDSSDVRLSRADLAAGLCRASGLADLAALCLCAVRWRRQHMGGT